MKLIFQFAFFLALLCGGIYLGSQNASEVDVIFFGREFEGKPLWMVMLISFATGSVISLLFCSLELLRAWKRIFDLKRQMKSFERQGPSESFDGGLLKARETTGEKYTLQDTIPNAAGRVSREPTPGKGTASGNKGSEKDL